jgi:aspartokinase/homoserine dehydrogenase 1
VAARLFGALGRGRVNILAIAQGSSELNVSIAVGRSEVDRAVRVLHQALGLNRLDTGAETPDGLDLILLGVGSIGRAVIEQMLSRREQIRERFGLRARVVALADRSGWVLEPAGLSDERLRVLLAAKARGVSLAAQGGTVGDAESLLDAALEIRLTRPVLVDCTDAETGSLFQRALSSGCDVATANKKPMAGPLEEYRELFQTAKTQGRLIRGRALLGSRGRCGPAGLYRARSRCRSERR